MHDPFALRADELLWVKYQPYLHSRGYQLRPRYRPGWVGSWKANNGLAILHEDSRSSPHANVIDARRIEDGIKVTLKRVPTTTKELPIARYLSSEALLSDPRNRTVRILDVIPLPDDDEWAMLVMPYLRQFDDPHFQFRVECVEFFRQSLQGLEFMHEHNVAHRDACHGNIMMDSSRLIPGGFQFAFQSAHDGPPIKRIVYTSRLAVAPVDYFFVDFGLSSHFASFEERHLVTGMAGQNKTVPELSRKVPYDPFKVDIYHLGGVFEELVENYHGLGVFQPLVTAMMRRNPTQRPDASSALAQFETIVSKLGSRVLKSRVLLYEKSLYARTRRKIRTGLEHSEGDDTVIGRLPQVLSQIILRRKNTKSVIGGTCKASATTSGVSGSKSGLDLHVEIIQRP
ncbi:kinase-like domain-containing protein [Gautieria morchelliformis]|nr:kinase-like domain-containing protein [Gautieria morchelliformis]